MVEVNADLCVAMPAEDEEELPVDLKSRVRNSHVGSKDVLHGIEELVLQQEEVHLPEKYQLKGVIYMFSRFVFLFCVMTESGRSANRAPTNGPSASSTCLWNLVVIREWT